MLTNLLRHRKKKSSRKKTQKMEDPTPIGKSSGCGLFNAVFGGRNTWLRRATSTGSISHRRRGSDDTTASTDSASIFSEPSSQPSSQKQKDRIIQRPGQNYTRVVPPAYHKIPQQQTAQNGGANQGRKPSTETKTTSKTAGPTGRKVPQNIPSISGELESMIADHQKTKESNNLVRASSGNVMLYGHLGNLRQPGGGGGGSGIGGQGNNVTANNVLNHLPKTAKEESVGVNGNHRSRDQQNPGANKQKKEEAETTNKPNSSLCRAISTRMDPEQLKIMGNEDYKNGRFAEALALYDAAISIDPNKASYRSNKSAALASLGRLLEAVFECREAIRIEPRYQRAHNRLATLYLRLGDAEKTIYHYKHAGADSDPDVLAKAQNVKAHLNRCTEAKKRRDWNTLVKETGLAISAGADAAPQIFALQAEALLKLHRHQDAEEVLTKGPNFDADICMKFFGPIGNANLLLIRAQVDMASGRFDEAVASAERAAKLDASNREANPVARRTKAVAMARSNGNNLFREQRYSEACAAYGEGLNHDPYNSVLLCNRATCMLRLGQFEKAIEDCTGALNVRPSYRKARQRRAECNAKLGRWEACIEDYEVMIRETPDDAEIATALKNANEQLRKQRGADTADSNVSIKAVNRAAT